MFKVYINLEGGLPYHLCTCTDLLSLWAVFESLLGEGTGGVEALGVVRVVPGQTQTVFRPPVT